MSNRGYALAREEMVRALTAYSGITTAAGAVVGVRGTTLIDSNLIGRNDFISGKTILIMSGDAKDEDKGAIDFDNTDGKITLQGTGFNFQIKAGTIFRVLNISSVETLILNLVNGLISFSGTTTAEGGAGGSSLICSDLGDEADFNGNQVVITSGDYKGQARDITADTTGGTVTPHLNFGGVIVEGTEFIITAIRVVPAEVAALAAALGEMDDAATSDDMSDITTTSALAKLRLILNRLSTDAFSARVQGGNRTALDTMLAQLATYFVGNGEVLDIKLNNLTSRDNLQEVLKDFFTIVGCLNTNIFTPVIDGAGRTTFEDAFHALSLYWAPAAEQLDIKLNNGVAKNTLKEVLKDFFTMVGCLDTNIFTPVIDGAGRTTFEDAFHALSLYWAPAAEQLDIKLNNGVAKNTLKEVLKDFFTMVGCLDTNIFTPVIDGAGRTTFEDAFHALSLYWAPAAEQLDIKLNDGVAKNTLKEVLKDYFTMIGCLDTNVFNPVIGGTPRTTFDAAFAAIGTALAALIGATGIFHEQADVPLSFNTVNGSETNVLNLVAASTRYIVRSLRLKFADPGGETITVRLYELVNDGLIEVDSFEVTTANFATYHSLMDMFGMAQLTGDNLKVTTRVSAGADIATLGQYSYAKTNV